MSQTFLVNLNFFKYVIKLYFYSTEEGEVISKYQQSLELENDGLVTLLWPQTVAHVIDSKSPLYKFSAHDILSNKFEIILSITGNSSRYGQLSQSRTSYLSREISWGHRFKNIITLDSIRGTYIADYSSFDKTDVITTALCSAMQLEQVMSEIKKAEQVDDAADNYSERNISDYGIEKFNVHTAPIASNDADDDDDEYENDIDDVEMLTTGLMAANH